MPNKGIFAKQWILKRRKVVKRMRSERIVCIRQNLRIILLTEIKYKSIWRQRS